MTEKLEFVQEDLDRIATLERQMKKTVQALEIAHGFMNEQIKINKEILQCLKL